MYDIIFSNDAVRYLKKLDKQTANRIYSKIMSILDNPYHYTKSLVDMGNLRKMRAGDYRVILEIDDDKVMVMIIDIGHRRNIYQ